MRSTLRALLPIAGVLFAACDQSITAPPATWNSRGFASQTGVSGPIVTGSGDVIRDLGNGPELTTFAYNAVRQGTGDVNGHFVYVFRAAEFSMEGDVTCATVVGNVAWLGGVITTVKSDDPADQSFVGTDVWWRVEDNGDGGSGTPDRTTSLLLTLPGDPTTAQSWCNDQPLRGVVRSIVAGNIVVH